MRRVGGSGGVAGPAEETQSAHQNTQSERGGASPLALADEWYEIEGEGIALRGQRKTTRANEAPASALSGDSRSGWGVWIGVLLGVADPDRGPDVWKVSVMTETT